MIMKGPFLAWAQKFAVQHFTLFTKATTFTPVFQLLLVMFYDKKIRKCIPGTSVFNLRIHKWTEFYFLHIMHGKTEPFRQMPGALRNYVIKNIGTSFEVSENSNFIQPQELQIFLNSKTVLGKTPKATTKVPLMSHQWNYVS